MLLTLLTATNTLPCPPSVPESLERSVQRTHFIVREGTAHARCDAGGTRTIVHRGMDGLVVLRHAERSKSA